MLLKASFMLRIAYIAFFLLAIASSSVAAEKSSLYSNVRLDYG